MVQIPSDDQLARDLPSVEEVLRNGGELAPGFMAVSNPGCDHEEHGLSVLGLMAQVHLYGLGPWSDDLEHECGCTIGVRPLQEGQESWLRS
jgi:hypothetical protein